MLGTLICQGHPQVIVCLLTTCLKYGYVCWYVMISRSASVSASTCKRYFSFVNKIVILNHSSQKNFPENSSTSIF